MAEADELKDLIRRVRSGDPTAATELVVRFEPYVRRAVRVEMRDPRLRRVFDSSDFCQSVWASFLARLALGQFNLDRPEQLVRLLATMARNKVASRARRPNLTRELKLTPDERSDREARFIDPGPDPSRIVVGSDLLEAVRDRLSEEERQLSDLRVEGHTWSEIAAEVGGNPDSLRFRLTRALDRVAREVGLDDPDDR
jgi:RNA polymerase sigma-70 factor (ECF subfamily)